MFKYDFFNDEDEEEEMPLRTKKEESLEIKEWLENQKV
jgi:hypothetical protein